MEGHSIQLEIVDLEHLSKFTASLASLLLPGDVLLLNGDLGAGKTTFVQYLAKSLGVGHDQYVSSPSFALVHEYEGVLSINHMDLYRLSGEEDVEEAGLLEYFNDASLCIVEWPDRLESSMPEQYLQITLSVAEGCCRMLEVLGVGEQWEGRVEKIAMTTFS